MSSRIAGQVFGICALLALVSLLAGCGGGGGGGGSESTTQIAFMSDRNGGDALFLMNGDGTGPREVIAAMGIPVLSPDGSKIAFIDVGIDGAADIIMAKTDGTDRINLTNNSAVDTNPQFRPPDGQKIIFTSDRSIFKSIYTMDLSGLNVTRLTDGSNDSAPAFSPDGSKIVFSRQNVSWDIYVMNASGPYDQAVQLTDDPGDDMWPRFAANGSVIVFMTNRDGQYEIYRMDASNGGNLRNLTNNPADDRFPCVSPDSTMIAFSSNRNGTADIYIMDLNGDGLERLTWDPHSDHSPSWSVKPALVY